MPQLVLNSVIRAIGFTQGGWRHPDATPQRALDLDYYQEYAHISERGLFDGLFVANTPAARSNDWTTLFSPLEPVSLLSALAPTTSHIGLIATLSSTLNDPFTVARQIATLDHLSAGRAGVNIVTSGSVDAARNFSYDELPDHSVRYERAHEFLGVLFALWDSWAADALIVDKAAGIQAKQDGIRPIGHRGKHFSVHGPLDVPRSPQDRPLVFQSCTDCLTSRAWQANGLPRDRPQPRRRRRIAARHPADHRLGQRASAVRRVGRTRRRRHRGVVRRGRGGRVQHQPGDHTDGPHRFRRSCHSAVAGQGNL